MKRTHDISIWPLNAKPPKHPDLICTTQREALKLFGLLDQPTCALLTGRRSPHRIRLTTHTGRQPSYHADACTLSTNAAPATPYPTEHSTPSSTVAPQAPYTTGPHA